MNDSGLIAKMVKAAQNGEEPAWKFLYNKYYALLYTHALKILGNAASATDAVQDSFLSAYLHLHQLKNYEAFGGWLKKNLLRNCYRSNHSSWQYENTPGLSIENNTPVENEIEKKYEVVNNKSQLIATIAKLAEPLSCTLLLRYFSAFQSYEQIAVILGIPVGTVRSRLNQSKQKILTHWAKNDIEHHRIFTESEEWSHFYYTHFTNVHCHFICCRY